MFIGKLTSISKAQFLGKVERIDLPIHAPGGCVQSLSVSLKTGKEECTTTMKESFENGVKLSWANAVELGGCYLFMVDNSTQIELHTPSDDDFCVGGLMNITTVHKDLTIQEWIYGKSQSDIPNGTIGTTRRCEDFELQDYCSKFHFQQRESIHDEISVS